MRISSVYLQTFNYKLQNKKNEETSKGIKPFHSGIIAFRAKGNRNQIAIATPECAPYAITGGAGSVMEQRSSFFKKMYPNKDLRIFIPFYNPKDKRIYQSTSITNPITKKKLSFQTEKTGVEAEFEYGVRKSKAELYKIKDPAGGVPTYLVYTPEFDDFFKEYDQSKYPHWKRYNIFCKALLALFEKTENSNEKFNPGLLHAVDSSASYLVTKDNQRACLYESTDAHRESDSYIAPFEAMLNIFSKKQTEEIKKDSVFRESIAELAFNNKKLCNDCTDTSSPQVLNEKLKNNPNFYNSVLVKIADNYDNLGQDLKNKFILEKINNVVRQKTKSDIYYDGNIDYSSMTNALRDCNNWFVPSDDYYKKVIASKYFCAGEFGSIAMLRMNNGCGIPNAIDLKLYDPKNPNQIVFPYDETNFVEGKSKNKKFLFNQFSKSNIESNKISSRVLYGDNQKVFGYLDPKYIDEPLIVNISRYNTQLKGQDIALKAIDKVLSKSNACIVVAMPGFRNIDYKAMDKFIKEVVNNPQYAGRIVLTDSYVPVNEYFAAADYSLVTSRSETCGLIGFQSMRMGAVPVSTPVGIMPTIVKSPQSGEDNATGYLTSDIFNKQDDFAIFANVLLKAISDYKSNPQLFNSMVKNCMTFDSSYKNSCAQLNNVYDKTIDGEKINDITLNELRPIEKRHNLSVLRPKDIESLEKADVLVMLAHPDDEVFFSPVLKYINEGKSVQFVYCAKGDKGAYRDSAPTHPEDLAAYREIELCNALNELGVKRNPLKLSIEDDSLYLHKEKLNDYADRIIEKVQPEVIFSFSPYGYTGHPDHKAVSKVTIDALNKYNSTHDKQIEIYQPVLSEKTAANFHNYAKQESSDSFDFVEKGAYTNSTSDGVKKVDVRKFKKQIKNSLKCHKSQWSDNEVKAIHKFYMNNPSELASIRSFDDTNEKYENPWKKREDDIKKLYGNEFYNIFNGIKMVNPDKGFELDLYLTFYNGSSDVDNTTMWINTDLFNDSKHRTEIFDLVIKSIDKIRKIPKFKKIENISFKCYDETKKEDCLYDIPIKDLEEMSKNNYQSFRSYERKNNSTKKEA